MCSSGRKISEGLFVLERATTLSRLIRKTGLIEFRKLSHDLVKTLNACVKVNKNLNDFRTQIESINKYSLLKYPDIEDEMVYSSDGLSISSNILKDVKQIGDFIKEMLAEKS